MPNYDFRCRKCEHRFTVKVAIKDRESVTCPQCGDGDLQQLFSGFGIQMKANKAASTGCPTCPHGGSCGMH